MWCTVILYKLSKFCDFFPNFLLKCLLYSICERHNFVTGIQQTHSTGAQNGCKRIIVIFTRFPLMHHCYLVASHGETTIV